MKNPVLTLVFCTIFVLFFSASAGSQIIHGLRVPRLTTSERDRIMVNGNPFAEGQLAYNIDIHCMQFWNGSVWVDNCMDCSGVTFPGVESSYNVCSGATVSDLITKLGGNVSFYNALTDGTQYAATDVVSHGGTYYAEQNIANCKNTAPRTQVTVSVGDCNTQLAGSAYKIFSPVSVMYTYQYQDLTLYKGVSTGGDASSFRWYVKKKGVSGNGDVIPSATSSTYRIPSNYRTSHDTLVFTCEYTNPATTTPQTVSTEIEFIKLNEANKITFNGVDYYWVELDVASSYTGSSNTSGKLKLLATNLGASANAADFGDLYQWGRVSDGHQTIGWSYTGTTSRTVGFDAATSANQAAKTTASYGENTDFPGSSLQIVKGDGLEGKFITSSSDYVWQASASNADQYIWAAQTTYAKTANDPCPPGWHVPTRYEWGALAAGSPSSASVSGTTYPTTYNVWRYPSAGFGSSSHIGGIVVTQGTDAAGASRVFLPAFGFRNYSDGTLLTAGTNGRYWSSSYDSTTHACNLFFNSGYVSAGNNFFSKGYGFSVRCLSE